MTPPPPPSTTMKNAAKKRICIISPRIYPLLKPCTKNDFGGAEVQLAFLARALSKKYNLEVHIMTGDYGQSQQEYIDGITIWNALKPSAPLFIQILQFLKILKTVHADYYIQRTLTEFSGIIAWFVHLLKSQLIYMVAHDHETNGKLPLFKNPLKAWLATMVFKQADCIICQNEYQQIQLNRQGILSFLVPSFYPIPAALDDEKERSYYLWVGRSDSWKRPEVVFTLAKSFPDADFVMICPKSLQSSEEYYQKLKKQALELSNLQFMDHYIPFEEIDVYFQHAKIFINTSEEEGFPNTFIQAAKNGVPIVSLAVNPNGFITKYTCGFHAENDEQALHDFFSSIQTSPEILKPMTKKAYTYAKEQHNIEINVQQILDIIGVSIDRM